MSFYFTNTNALKYVRQCLPLLSLWFLARECCIPLVTVIKDGANVLILQDSGAQQIFVPEPNRFLFPNQNICRVRMFSISRLDLIFSAVWIVTGISRHFCWCISMVYAHAVKTVFPQVTRAYPLCPFVQLSNIRITFQILIFSVFLNYFWGCYQIFVFCVTSITVLFVKRTHCKFWWRVV